MQIPRPPTDNLYKFLAITGLLVLATCIGINEHRNYIHSVENAQIRVGKETIDRKLAQETEEIDRVVSSVQANIARAKNSPEQLDHEAIDQLRDEIEELRRIAFKQSSSDWLVKDSSALRLKSELADASVAATRSMNIWLIFFGLVGLLSTLSGFVLWYYKLQRHQDRIIATEASGESKTPESNEILKSVDNPIE